MLQRMIIASIIRRLAGYLGVAGMSGFDSDVMQIGGAVVAAGTLLWSEIEKVRAYRKAQAAKGIPQKGGSLGIS